MKLEEFKRGGVIFRQGEPGDCMYDIHSGRVGIFFDYGGPGEKKLAELNPGEFFGEMGLLDNEVRSATAVALESDTKLERISGAEFVEIFRENPARVFQIMQQLSAKLRRVTRKYVDACHTASQVLEEDAAGNPRSSALEKELELLGKVYLAMSVAEY